MLTPQYRIPLHHELVVDLFAGGGGASTGIEQAIGRPVDIAINHDPEAVALHQANHPQTAHFVSDVFEVDPVIVTEGRPVGLLWASPDCKHFSKAKGGKPVSKKIRSLAWVVVKWAKLVRPRVIHLENVEEFQTWGPLDRDGRPCPQRMGPLTFEARRMALDRVLGIQAACNAAALALGRPQISLIDAEEEARIRELIDLQTWPQGWDGDEPTGDTIMPTIYQNGAMQPLLFSADEAT